MRGSLFYGLALLVTGAQLAGAQGYPGGQGGPGPITGSGGRTPQQSEIPSTPVEVKPEKAAAKAYAAGTKTINKAHELEDLVTKTTDPEKKSRAIEKLQDTYGKALDQFTEVLRNRSDMYDAWNQIGYVHLRLGAFRESIDDYNHALALKPDLMTAIRFRGEALLGIDHLDDAKAAYMDLFFHERELADQLMVSMQAWLQTHRVEAHGVRVADIEAFDKWLQERQGIAKTAAATN
jgi:tetratricopeptide (TPR) repeat protein